MERTPWTDDDDDDDDDDDNTGRPKASSIKVTDVTKVHQTLPSDWVKLMDNVKGLEISYFDARLNGWVDKWTDTSTLPNLVRVRLSLGEGRAPVRDRRARPRRRGQRQGDPANRPAERRIPRTRSRESQTK